MEVFLMLKKYKITCSLLFLLFFGFHSTIAEAAPKEHEIDSLVSKLGWTKEDLQTYLSYKGLQIEDFDTIDILESQLGTPITPTNLDSLLVDLDLSREELDILLAGFHEDVTDYWFIEDLEVAIEFYQNHEEKMIDLDNFLQKIGINDQEKQLFLTHLTKLDSAALSQHIQTWEQELIPLRKLDQNETLTSTQRENLIEFWVNYFKSTSLKPVITTIDDNGNRIKRSMAELVNEPLTDTIAIELYDDNELFIADAILTADMINIPFSAESVQKMVELASISEELSTLYAAQMPDTASSLPLFLCMGYILILGGLFILLQKNYHEKK